ncbi:MAG: helical backbone metal receptor [Ferruginibacter sp.]
MILNHSTDLDYIPSRIVSLVPSQTELLHYIGLNKEIIGITKFCLHPVEWFKTKTRIGGTKNIDIEKVIQLNPDLIIANKEENTREQIMALSKNFNIWVTDINNLQDALIMIKDIGQLTGKMEGTRILIEKIKENFTVIAKKSCLIPSVYLIWKEPFMTVGGDTYISNLMLQAGFKNVFSQLKRYPIVTTAEIIILNPALLFLSTEPYPFNAGHVEEMQKSMPGIKVVLVDGEMFSWYGSRLLLVPDYFQKLMSE